MGCSAASVSPRGEQDHLAALGYRPRISPAPGAGLPLELTDDLLAEDRQIIRLVAASDGQLMRVG
jgi:hypothetical protein